MVRKGMGLAHKIHYSFFGWHGTRKIRVLTESDWEPARDLVKIYRVIKKEEKGVRLENTLRIKTNEWRSLV